MAYAAFAGPVVNVRGGVFGQNGRGGGVFSSEQRGFGQQTSEGSMFGKLVLAVMVGGAAYFIWTWKRR